MIDLKDTTFIIPVTIESDDRLRNVITVCCFLLENFDTKVILKEVDTKSVFKESALPQISEYVEGSIKNLTHVHQVPDDSVFYRMRYLNSEDIIKNKSIYDTLIRHLFNFLLTKN